MHTVDPHLVKWFEAIYANAVAIGDAALAEDFDEARFRTHLVIVGAESLGMMALLHAAKVVEATLGESGDPLPGYGAAILGLAKSLRLLARAPSALAGSATFSAAT
ncbi:hypothetical protein [Luteibacter yeojuensis]|uniref:Uncharacterized protein n=1 Tax=Luteibacter yeojuensis TaxID=345309 RepID=A0A0F3KUY8_9GAMM|nr:hypothetical protein [Luteibacter yeojuensis]KJV34772.1 hypothetical protein VI08_09290 [Luteibacter yeojuensis]